MRHECSFDARDVINVEDDNTGGVYLVIEAHCGCKTRICFNGADADSFAHDILHIIRGE